MSSAKSSERISSTYDTWLAVSATMRTRLKYAVPDSLSQRVMRTGSSSFTPRGT